VGINRSNAGSVKKARQTGLAIRSQALSPDPAANGRLLQRIASGLGFLESDRTRALLSTPRRAVKGALVNKNRSVPGRFAAGILAAQEHPDHPFRTLAARYPEAVVLIAEFMRLRIGGSHHTSTLPTLDLAEEKRDQLFAFLRALLGTGPALDAADAGAERMAWGEDLILRVRAQAEQLTRSYEGIDDHPDLRARLIDVHHQAIIAELLNGTGDDETAGKPRLRDFALAAAIAMEALLAEIEAAAPTRDQVADGISEDREANADRITAAARSLGFRLGADGRLQDTLTHAQPDKIRRAAHGRSETLSAMLCAQLLSAIESADHPLRKVTQAAPDFVLHIADIVTAREHGDATNLEAGDVPRVLAWIRDDVRAVLATLD
jgi:hypothetical protein